MAKKQIHVKDDVKNGVKRNNDASKNVETKPTRGLNIGENFGWTGKLPLTLLNEHCQKQKWPKPKLEARQSKNGTLNIITLAWTNPKTKEVVLVRFNPRISKPTALESKHFSATYVLHRLNYKKNMKMVLPNIFRDYWDELEAERGGRDGDTIYNENPFLAQLKAQEAKKQKDQIHEKHQQRVSQGIVLDKTIVQQIQQVKSDDKDNNESAKISGKAWDNAPLFDIDTHQRIRIENAVKMYMEWTESTPQSDTKLPGVLMSLGFKQNHVNECLQYTNSFTKALEWLIFYLPEDDLPKFLMKSNYNTTFKVKIHKDWQLENQLKNLSDSGFNYDDILETWHQFGNEHDVAIALSKQLLSGESQIPESESQDAEYGPSDWSEELESIKAMDYDISYTESLAVVSMKQFKIRIYKPTNYPMDIPGIHILTNIPNYIKLHIVKNCLQYLINNQYFGMAYVFTIIDYLNENWQDLVQNPGPLYVAPTKSIASKPLAFMANKRRFRVNRDKIKSSYEARTNDSQFLALITMRKKLPAWFKQRQLLELIKNCKNQVVLVTGETGSGKSTQIVQFLVDDLCQQGDYQSLIMCSQPRRISVLGLADRISYERSDRVGNEVGYMIRGESKTSDLTRVVFVTTGVLIRLLNSQESMLKQLRYVVIDEVHERSLDVDFLLVVLKTLKAKYPKLTIVLMSATIEKTKFDQFYGNVLDHIHIEGRTFPIETKYLDDIIEEIDYKLEINDQMITPRTDSQFFKSGRINYDLLMQLCKHLVKTSDGGSILVFLPGVYEINQLIKKLDIPNTVILPLHSGLTSRDQKQVFNSVPGRVKIVVSTNIAETSITIPDCTCVIDCGRVKTMYFDQSSNSTKLVEQWCSQAEAQQRRGRAGRVQAGRCYRVYLQTMFDSMEKQPIPEIKRASINNMYLMIKSIGIKDVGRFLSEAIDPPSVEKVELSEKYLSQIGCVSNNNLTNLGKFVSLLPMDLNMGKLIILGGLFGCLDNCLIIASVKSVGSPFLKSAELRNANKSILQSYSKDNGDLLGILNLIKEFIKSPKPSQFIKQNNLSYTTINDIVSTKTQFQNVISELAITNDNRNDGNFRILQAIITASYYPNIAKVHYPNSKYFATSSGSLEIDADARLTKYYVHTHQGTKRVFTHPSSSTFKSDASAINVDQTGKPDLTPTVQALSAKHPFVAYGNLHETTKLYINEITPTSAISVILFGGEIDYDLGNGVSPGITIDKWITIRTWCKNAVLIKYLRNLLDMNMDSVLSGHADTEILSIVEDMF